MIKVLIVEDDPALLRLCQNTLKIEEDFTVDSATNGKEALSKIATFMPDVVLLDIMMPEMNGIEVLVSMKTNPKTAGIVVIVFTNAFKGKSVDSALALGAADFVIKSDIDYSTLGARIRAAVAKSGSVAPTASDAPKPAL